MEEDSDGGMIRYWTLYSREWRKTKNKETPSSRRKDLTLSIIRPGAKASKKAWGGGTHSRQLRFPDYGRQPLT